MEAVAEEDEEEGKEEGTGAACNFGAIPDGATGGEGGALTAGGGLTAVFVALSEFSMFSFGFFSVCEEIERLSEP